MPTLRIASKRSLTDRIAEFVLEPIEGRLPEHSAGAHVDVDLGAAGARAYSLIDWPGDAGGRWRIAVQREDAGQGGSKAMHAFEAGDMLTAGDPANDFPLADGPKPVALIAGGIGVTPLISMATALTARGRDFAFHYAGRSRAATAYADELATAFGDRMRFHFDDEKMIDLPAVMAGLGGHHIHICGPKPMIEAARAAAEAAGTPADHIHVELFTTPEAGEDDASFEVEITSTGQVFTVPPGKTIVEVLEAAGVDLMYDCQRGDCGICQTDIISGTPDHRDVVLSQAERDAGKVMQICISRALSERLVLDL